MGEGAVGIGGPAIPRRGAARASAGPGDSVPKEANQVPLIPKVEQEEHKSITLRLPAGTIELIDAYARYVNGGPGLRGGPVAACRVFAGRGVRADPRAHPGAPAAGAGERQGHRRRAVMHACSSSLGRRGSCSPDSLQGRRAVGANPIAGTTDGIGSRSRIFGGGLGPKGVPR